MVCNHIWFAIIYGLQSRAQYIVYMLSIQTTAKNALTRSIVVLVTWCCAAKNESACCNWASIVQGATTVPVTPFMPRRIKTWKHCVSLLVAYAQSRG